MSDGPMEWRTGGEPTLGNQSATNRHRQQRRRLCIYAIASAALLLGACSTSTAQSVATTSTTQASAGSTATSVSPAPSVTIGTASKLLEVDLGGGAKLVLPAGAVPSGATVTLLDDAPPPPIADNRAAVGKPVHLTLSNGQQLTAPATIEFPYDPNKTNGLRPEDAFGIATFDETARRWNPVPFTVDTNRHMLIAQTPHFSWWDPFSWDWSTIFNNLGQGLGQMYGNRASPPSCNGPATPNWATAVITSAGPSQPLEVCTETWGDQLAVKVVNNRPHAIWLALDRTASIATQSFLSTAATTFLARADPSLSHGVLIPGNESVVVKVPNPGAGNSVQLSAFATFGSVGIDALKWLVEYDIGILFDGPLAPQLIACFKAAIDSGRPGASDVPTAIFELADCLKDNAVLIGSKTISMDKLTVLADIRGVIESSLMKHIMALGYFVDFGSDINIYNQGGGDITIYGPNPSHPPVNPPPPVQPPATPPPAPTVDCERFVADATIPDGSTVDAGATFTKTWQLRNCGNTTWTEFQAVRISGTFGPTSTDTPAVNPNDIASISATVTAPTEPGHYRATYQLRGPRGLLSGVFWVDINVNPVVQPQPPAPTQPPTQPSTPVTASTSPTTTSHPIDRTAITSYDRMQPGAPYHGDFTTSWQPFIAQSNTITLIGATVGTPGGPAGVGVAANLQLRLCADQACTQVLASATPQIVNYGSTIADIGDVTVIPGQTYWIVWSQPSPLAGKRWVTYWWAGGSNVTASDQMQALIRGYNR